MSDKPANKPHHHLRGGNASTNPDRAWKPGFRDRATIKRLNMYRSRPKRDKNGVIISGGLSKELPNSRIAPNRRWFGNTRVVGQDQLAAFRTSLSEAKADPYSFVMKTSKVPWSLLDAADRAASKALKAAQPKLLEVAPFESTFGPAKLRKRPTLAAAELPDLMAKADASSAAYDGAKDSNVVTAEDTRPAARNPVLEKGQSKRIWGELWKVVDSSDVVVEVLDARDPMGTRARHVEAHLRKNARHKHLVFVLNKCDLIPVWATARWVKVLSAEAPTLAFHASITNPFGKGALIQLLRQFARLHTDRRQISVGFIGYPNVGKSSVINTLAGKKACMVAPIPGETKVWQYIRLMRNIFLVDCPGVVYDAENASDADVVLKGARPSPFAPPSPHLPSPRRGAH